MHCSIPLLILLAPAEEPHLPLSEAPRFARDAEDFAHTLLEALEFVPGLGLAVVVEDRIVLAEGFGTADVEHDLAADGDTVYYIASATKPFTALMASVLEQRGEIDLDSSLADYLDDGRIDPALEPERILLRDLLCHTSGLENDPITMRLAYTGEHDPQTLWRLLPETFANSVGRGRFQYSNFGYNLFTMLLERELGRPWQELLQEVVLDPLGLTHTSAYASVPRDRGFVLAAPYDGLAPEGARRLPLEKTDAQMQSAGGMLTSPRDAARWLLFQLHDGELDGEALVDAGVVQSSHRAWARIEGREAELLGGDAYGGGWMIADYHGQPVLHHAGDYPGFAVLFAFLPEARVGVAVFLNGTIGANVRDLVRDWAFDWWLGEDPERAVARIEKLVAERDRARTFVARMLESLQDREWQLTKDPQDYAGTFVNDVLGTLVVTPTGASFEVRLGLLRCTATPYPEPECLRAELIPGEGSVVRFEPDTAGGFPTLLLNDVRFERRKG